MNYKVVNSIDEFVEVMGAAKDYSSLDDKLIIELADNSNIHFTQDMMPLLAKHLSLSKFKRHVKKWGLTADLIVYAALGDNNRVMLYIIEQIYKETREIPTSQIKKALQIMVKHNNIEFIDELYNYTDISLETDYHGLLVSAVMGGRDNLVEALTMKCNNEEEIKEALSITIIFDKDSYLTRFLEECVFTTEFMKELLELAELKKSIKCKKILEKVIFSDQNDKECKYYIDDCDSDSMSSGDDKYDYFSKDYKSSNDIEKSLDALDNFDALEDAYDAYYSSDGGPKYIY